MRLLSTALGLIAIALTFWFFGPRPAPSPPQAPPGYQKAKGDALFASSFKQFSSAVVPLAPFEGQPVVVYFWASWCVPCRDEAQALLALQTKYRSNGLVVIGIGVDQSDNLQRFVRDLRIDHPVFAGGAAAIELSRKLGNLRLEMPFAAAVDRVGRVSATHLGKFGPATPETLAAAALR